jgi:hypothetical protein
LGLFRQHEPRHKISWLDVFLIWIDVDPERVIMTHARDAGGLTPDHQEAAIDVVSEM